MAKRKWTKVEIEEYRKLHPGLYFNKEDSNFFVPKSFGIGLTLNWANPFSWIFVLAIIGLIIWRKFF